MMSVSPPAWNAKSAVTAGDHQLHGPAVGRTPSGGSDDVEWSGPRPAGAASFDAGACSDLDAPGLWRRESHGVKRLESHLTPASARREPGHRRRHALPRPDRLQRARCADRPAIDAAVVGVDDVEEPPVAGEVLVPQTGHAVDRDAGRRILQ